MEFRKMVTLALYAKQKRHRCTEQTFGLCGRRWGMFWENSIEASILSRVKQIASPGWMHETRMRAGALGRPRGMGWRRRREGGSGRGTHVNPLLIHVNVWQKPLQYCKVISLQLIKINEKKKKADIKKKKQQRVWYFCYHYRSNIDILWPKLHSLFILP